MPRIYFCAEPSCRWHEYAWTVEDADLYDRQWHDPPGPQRVKRGGKWYCEQHGRVGRERPTRAGKRAGVHGAP